MTLETVTTSNGEDGAKNRKRMVATLLSSLQRFEFLQGEKIWALLIT